MPPVLDLLTWLHLGIALIGSFYCLLLAVLLLYFYRDPFRSERYLASWLALLALYFGLVPNQLPSTVLLPAYTLQFFALPCLYLYLEAQLRRRRVRAGWHLTIPAALSLYALATVQFHVSHQMGGHLEADEYLLALLPLGALAQYLYYARATWQLWRRWGYPNATTSARPRTQNYAWLLTLTITSGLVWLLRLIGVSIPLWNGQPLAPWVHVSKRIAIIGLLLFGLAYGLRQITSSVWVQRRRTRPRTKARKPRSESVLSPEELTFLRDLNKKN